MTVNMAPAYRAAAFAANGSCPIDAGLVGRLVDNECRHERMPGDPGWCLCWSYYEGFNGLLLQRSSGRVELERERRRREHEPVLRMTCYPKPKRGRPKKGETRMAPDLLAAYQRSKPRKPTTRKKKVAKVTA